MIRQQLATGGSFTRSAAVVAAWARYAEGTDENGVPHGINDGLAPQLQAAARRQRGHPAAFLEATARSSVTWPAIPVSPRCTARS